MFLIADKLKREKKPDDKERVKKKSVTISSSTSSFIAIVQKLQRHLRILLNMQTWL